MNQSQIPRSTKKTSITVEPATITPSFESNKGKWKLLKDIIAFLVI